MVDLATALLAALAAAAPAASSPPAAAGDPADAPPPPRAVYRLHPRADAAVMSAAALAISVPSLLAREIIRERCPCDPATVNRFDRGAIGNHDRFSDVASDVTVLLAMGAPPLLDLADVGAGDAWAADVAVFAETLLVNGALVEAAKYLVQRPLPRTYAGDPALVGSPGGYRSFWSGHTSTAFAALGASAYTLRLRHGERGWPWIAAAAIGASVAVERVAAGRHFPSDVIVGAAVGSAVGIGVPWLHAAPRAPVAIVPGRRSLAIAIAF